MLFLLKLLLFRFLVWVFCASGSSHIQMYPDLWNPRLREGRGERKTKERGSGCGVPLSLSVLLTLSLSFSFCSSPHSIPLALKRRHANLMKFEVDSLGLFQFKHYISSESECFCAYHQKLVTVLAQEKSAVYLWVTVTGLDEIFDVDLIC